jgi:homoprotocatechuate degradation regulator HpaR
MREFHRAPPMMLARALEAVKPGFRAVFAQFDMTETQWRVLRILWENDGCGLMELSRATLVSAPSLVGVISRMVRNGLVVRERSAADRRQIDVRLTQKGRTLKKRIMPLVEAAYAELEEAMSPAQWRGFYEALDALEDWAQKKRDAK